jgi:F1F0 ATPase subunit 2
MIEAARLLMACMTGAALGIFYFGGLWLILRILPSVKRPGRFMVASTVIRMSVILTAFLLFTLIHWTFSVFALIGFILVRGIITGRRRMICRA